MAMSQSSPMEPGWCKVMRSLKACTSGTFREREKLIAWSKLWVRYSCHDLPLHHHQRAGNKSNMHRQRPLDLPPGRVYGYLGSTAYLERLRTGLPNKAYHPFNSLLFA